MVERYRVEIEAMYQRTATAAKGVELAF